MQSCLFDCRVRHQRYAPVDYGFTSRLFMWWLDLDALPELVESLPLLSHNQPNFYEFRDADHLYLGFNDLRANVAAFLRANAIHQHPAKVHILTNLRTFGFVFNPVSFIFCSDADAQPFAVIAEVHNTFGELKPFLLGPEHFAAAQWQAAFPKLFYISPFSHLDHRLRVRARFPTDKLLMQVDNLPNTDPKPFFRASIAGHRVPLSTQSLARFSLRFPLVTLRVVAAIHFHALRLYLKKTPLYRKSMSPELQQGIVPKRHSSHA